MDNTSIDKHSSQPASFRLSRIVTFCFAFIFLLLWFGCLDERELFHPDEGRYAQIPHEMVASGDWITPRLNGFKYFEKPVLQYWITAVSFLALGEEEFVARLWPALAGFLTLFLVYSMGRRLSGVHAGVVAAAALATTFQFFVFSQILTLDMGLSFFLTLALYGFLGSQDLRGSSPQRRANAMLMWIAMALAVLSKGLVGIVLPALVLAVYIVIERDWKLLDRLHWGVGLPAFLIITLPWFVWVQWRNPEFFQFFFIHEHFGRYALNQHHRPGAWYYFIAMLLFGGLPWSYLYAKATLTTWRRSIPNRFAINPIRLLVLWVVTITIFYSVSRSKLPGYILPVYPALAVLMGCHVQQVKIQLSRWLLGGIAVIGLTIAAAAPFIPRIPKFNADADLISPFVPWAVASGGVLLVAAILALATKARYPRIALITLGFGVLISFQVLVTGTESIEDHFSAESLVEKALDKVGEFDPDVPFYSIDMYDQTMPQHIGRLLTLVHFRGEMDMGIAIEPGKALASLEEFRRRWQGQAQAYAIMPRARFEEEHAAGTRLNVLSMNRNTVIAARTAITESTKKPRRTDD